MNVLFYKHLSFKAVVNKNYKMQKIAISNMRLAYVKGRLKRADLPPDPILQMEKWVSEAIDSAHPESLAMHLSTVGADGQPHLRVVLLKGIEDGSLVFFTNYESAKAKDMALNQAVAALFFWPLLERQIRIEGTVKKIGTEASDYYFASRPRASQIGAWASPQSTEIQSQEQLEQLYIKAKKRYENQSVPRPPHWGGYAIVPVLFEFWQGQPDRMHHRFRYKIENNCWNISQLAP